MSFQRGVQLFDVACKRIQKLRTIKSPQTSIYSQKNYFGLKGVNIHVSINEEFFKKLSENHPYISICSYASQDYVGIIQNRDDSVTTIYDYGAIVIPDLRTRYLELGDIWWWESNRTIPINIFLKEDWIIFKPYIRTFNNKSLDIVHGPIVSMNEFIKKRSKRRSITLVKRMP